MTLRLMTLSNMSDCNAKCHHYAECHYAECHYAECRYAECHGAETTTALQFRLSLALG